MELDKYIQTAGEYLKAEDVKTNPTAKFVITSEGEFVENKFGNERLHLNGEFSEAKKVFDVSKTNAKIIADSIGTDSKTWIGKQLTLETYKTRTSEGKMVDAINIKEVQ